MSEFIINGGAKLCGRVRVQGAKNSALPILAASFLSGGECVLNDCPCLSDSLAAVEILRGLGCRAEMQSGKAVIDACGAGGFSINDSLMRRMRSSIMFLGSILARTSRAEVSCPGGCALGARPIDIHLKALRELGVEIDETEDYISCRVKKYKPCELELDFPSVGATENIMMFAAANEGEVKIHGAAREPEIVDLQNFLNLMGADICGAGCDTIKIRGRGGLHGCEYTIMPDRIVAATYLCALIICGGEIKLENVIPEHIRAPLARFEHMGLELEIKDDVINANMNGRALDAGIIKTMPYPGFPTDIQPQLMAACAAASGTTVFAETIFDNRFRQAAELIKMGADIVIHGRNATVKGVKSLHGADVRAGDLRGGAALAIAALGADGTSRVGGIEHIKRGYADLCADLKGLGADITEV